MEAQLRCIAKASLNSTAKPHCLGRRPGGGEVSEALVPCIVKSLLGSAAKALCSWTLA
jgi:hypothetical protein